MRKEVNYKNKINDLNKYSKCSGCRAKIYWIKTDNNKNMPIDPDGVSHFATCPAAVKFRKKS